MAESGDLSIFYFFLTLSLTKMHSFHRNGSDQLFNIVLPQGNDTYYNTYYTYILHIHTTHLVHAGDVPDIYYMRRERITQTACAYIKQVYVLD